MKKRTNEEWASVHEHVTQRVTNGESIEQACKAVGVNTASYYNALGRLGWVSPMKAIKTNGGTFTEYAPVGENANTLEVDVCGVTMRLPYTAEAVATFLRGVVLATREDTEQ